MTPDPIQHEFDRIYNELKKHYPNYCYNLLESRMNAFLSSQMSKFRHRKNNLQEYTGIDYDPEGKLKIPDEDPIDDKDIIFFSSRIEAC